MRSNKIILTSNTNMLSKEDQIGARKLLLLVGRNGLIGMAKTIAKRTIKARNDGAGKFLL